MKSYRSSPASTPVTLTIVPEPDCVDRDPEIIPIKLAVLAVWFSIQTVFGVGRKNPLVRVLQ